MESKEEIRKPFIVANVRDLLNQFNRAEISFSFMVEKLNETAFEYSDKKNQWLGFLTLNMTMQLKNKKMKQLLKYSDTIDLFLDKSNNSLVLTSDYMSDVNFNKLLKGLILPQDIVFRNFKHEIKNFILRNGLGRTSKTRAKVVFRYEGKDYLLIYNK